MKTVLQWIGAFIILLVLAFLGMQVYTSETHCKNMIHKDWSYNIVQVFYSPIDRNCYLAIEESESIPNLNGQMVPWSKYLSIHTLENDWVERTGIRSSRNVIVKLLNTLWFWPVWMKENSIENGARSVVSPKYPIDDKCVAPGVVSIIRWSKWSIDKVMNLILGNKLVVKSLNNTFYQPLALTVPKASVIMKESWSTVEDDWNIIAGSVNDQWESMLWKIRYKNYVSWVWWPTYVTTKYTTNIQWDVTYYPDITINMKELDGIAWQDRKKTMPEIKIEEIRWGSAEVIVPIWDENKRENIFSKKLPFANVWRVNNCPTFF